MDVLCDHKVICKIKGRLYRLAVIPAMLHEAEMWTITFTQSEENKTDMEEMRIIRWTTRSVVARIAS